jgi:hypothetical protein
MAASSSQSDNDKLEEFFNDVEKLTIHSNDCNDDAGDAIVCRQDKIQAKASTKEMLSRAEAGRKSWTDFFDTVPPNSTNSLETHERRRLVSFSLKKKGKKPKSKKPSDKEQNMPPLPPLSLQRPRWIAVLDTCAAIESYEAICDLIFEATKADPRETGVECITVVIPYKLWDELDYRSKKAGGEGYRERRVLRMLNNELENQGRSHLLKTSDAVRVIRTQSRAEMGKANQDFLTTHGAMDTNNDDSILSCALAEQGRLLAEPVGSNVPMSGDKVVLLTLDKVLSGKARADGVTPYTPVDFVEYYKQRAASLRQRTRLMH